MSNKNIATASTFMLSLTITPNNSVFLFMTAADSMPPAMPPKKYATISNTPCGRYVARATGIPDTPPTDLAVRPMAADKTEAFHDRINIAPEPKINANKTASRRTPILLTAIFINVFENKKLPRINLISCIWSSKSFVTVLSGKKMNVKDNATIIPEKNAV